MLTITEGQSVNDVLRLLLAPPDSDGTYQGRGRESALLLASHAHRALAAGITAGYVSDTWKAYVERREATLDLLSMFSDGMLVLDLGPRLSCKETEALARWLRAHQLEVDALALIATHAETDDEGDDHYRGTNDTARSQR